MKISFEIDEQDLDLVSKLFRDAQVQCLQRKMNLMVEVKCRQVTELDGYRMDFYERKRQFYEKMAKTFKVEN